jgi:tRNA (guanine-N7-)-methyltransferase
VYSINKPLRPIRSFVRREGRMTNAQKKAVDQLDRVYGLDLTQQEPASDPFPGRTDITLEIGFGDGDTLLTLARANPSKAYIGIDPHRPGAGRLLLRLASEGLENVKVVVGDAAELIPVLVPDNYFAQVLVLFPDPWPKKRHQKRRLINPEFLEMLAQKMQKGGVLHLATDWLEYAEQMLDTLSKVPAFKNLDPSGRYTPRPDWRPETKYERRGLRLGHDVFDISLVRK